MPRLPQKLSDTGYQATLINQIIDYLAAITPKDSDTIKHVFTPFGVRSEINNFEKRIGNFKGEYDQTQFYIAGDTFKISTATTISGISVIAGYYGVPPAGADVLGHLWAGYVPPNPTGNAVPQSPLPSIGSAPNDKFYADLIGEYC